MNNLTDITSIFSTVFDFLFSSNYAVFGVPIAIYLFVPPIIGIIIKFIKRGSN